ncbi:MAG: isochorismate synthase [Acidimicrobiia bacterium]
MTSTPAPARLRAVTREVSVSEDLDALVAACGPHDFAWLHHDVRIVATGVAARVGADDVADALAAIEVDDPLGLPGTGAIAVGALPFDPEQPGELVIPARVHGESQGRAWVTEIGPSVDDAPAEHDGPARFTVAATRSRGDYEAIVGRAIDAIGRGEVEKVVLAREVVVEADQPFDVRDVIARLVHQQPGCFVYASSGLVGASPELLVRRGGAVVESRPVAGTAVAEGEESLRRLAASVKDTNEHRFVVDSIVEALTPVCTALQAGTPEVAVFGPIAHLATPVRGELNTDVDALTLARMLHPTPAVGGTPRQAALDAIRELEGFDRGRYAGPVGWVDAHGDGEWAIALRGAELDGTRARLVAGAGIVAGSDPAAEWAETQAKLEPMLRALVRP